MLLLAFSSNVTPRIFFATAPPPGPYLVQTSQNTVQTPEMEPGTRETHGEEDRSGRALLVPRLRGLLEEHGRRRRSRYPRPRAGTPVGVRRPAPRNHGPDRHRAVGPVARRARRAGRARYRDGR